MRIDLRQIGLHLPRGARRALGIIFVSHRRSEEGQEFIAVCVEIDCVDHSAESPHRFLGWHKVLIQGSYDLSLPPGSKPVGDFPEADDVAEQDGHPTMLAFQPKRFGHPADACQQADR